MFHKNRFALGAFTIAVLGNMVLGTNTVVTKFAFESMDPLLFTALRHVFMGLILVLLIKNTQALKSSKALQHICISGGLLLLFIVFFTAGLDQSTAMKAAVMSLVTPAFVYLFSITLLHEPLIKRALAGGMMALFGSLLLIGLPAVTPAEFEFGDVLLLLSYIALAASIVHAKYLFWWLEPVVVIGVRCLVAGTLLVAFVLASSGISILGEADAVAWGALVYASVVSGAIGSLLFFWALKKLRAENAAPVFYVDPLIGTLAAAVLLDDRLGLGSLAAAAIILAGVMYSYPHHTQVFHRYHVHNPHLISLLHHKLSRFLNRL